MSGYVYSGGDRLAEPHSYMYTPFEGADFLRAYFADRAPLAAPEDAGEARRALKAKPWGEPGTAAAVLAGYVGALLDGATPVADTHGGLDEFVRRYEVSKKLFRSYPGPGRKGEGSHLELAPYALLALSCALRRSAGGTLKYLNCLLKVDDMLISRRDSLGPEELALARAAVGLETRLVRELMALQGVHA